MSWTIQVLPAERLSPSELAFIHDSWARSFRPCLPQMGREAFFGYHRALRESLLKRSSVLLARDLDEPRYIHGYGIFEPENTLHWSFVKQASRNRGVFLDLVRECLAMTDAPTLTCTHDPVSRTFVRKLDDLGFVRKALPKC